MAPILRTLQPDFGWGGDLRVAATAVVRSAPDVKVDVVVQRVSGDLTVSDEAGTRALGLTDLRLGVVADNGVWQFTQAFAGGRLGSAAGAVTVRTSPQAFWPPPEAPMQGVLEAHVADLSAWGSWLPPGWRVSGRIDTTASIGGRFGAPEVAGRIAGSGLGVRNVLEGINVTDGELRVALAGDTARIERFVLHGGAGTLRVEGAARLGSGLASPSGAPGAPPPVAPPPSADLRIVADDFRLLARVDRRVVVSGQARVRLADARVDVAGDFEVDEGLIDFTRSDAPSLSDDVVVIRSADRPDPNAPVKPKAGAAPFDLALDLGVDLGSNLRLRGRGIDTGLAGKLRITAPGGRLAVNGSIRTVGGTFNAYNQKLTIERGVITFTGAVENPRLDIQAMRTAAATDISDVRVGVLVSGTAVAPRVRLYSEPEMTDTDKLSYLVLGRAPDGLGGSELGDPPAGGGGAALGRGRRLDREVHQGDRPRRAVGAPGRRRRPAEHHRHRRQAALVALVRRLRARPERHRRQLPARLPGGAAADDPRPVGARQLGRRDLDLALAVRPGAAGRLDRRGAAAPPAAARRAAPRRAAAGCGSARRGVGAAAHHLARPRHRVGQRLARRRPAVVARQPVVAPHLAIAAGCALQPADDRRGVVAAAPRRFERADVDAKTALDPLVELHRRLLPARRHRPVRSCIPVRRAASTG